MHIAVENACSLLELAEIPEEFDTKIIELLIKLGVHPNLKDQGKQTPLDLARSKDNQKLVNFFITATSLGQSIDNPSTTSETPNISPPSSPVRPLTLFSRSNSDISIYKTPPASRPTSPTITVSGTPSQKAS